MHCYICDDIINDDKVKTNFRTKKVEPCPKCMEAIHSTTDDYEEQKITPFIPDTDTDGYLEGDYEQPTTDSEDT